MRRLLCLLLIGSGTRNQDWLGEGFRSLFWLITRHGKELDMEVLRLTDWPAPWSRIVLLSLFSVMCLVAAGPERVVNPKELPRFPAVAAANALKTFQLRKGFRLELVAAEPLVNEPVAIAFDADGRLFVIEMKDFPEGKERLGEVRRLVDTDGDGRFDRSTIFATGLRWPSAIHCYGGGVFVGSVPDLIFYKDTDDDGVADEKKVVLTGWGNRANALNPEGVFGSLTWGLDNRIHGLVNLNPGDITNPNDPSAKPVRLGGNFAFDPRTMASDTGQPEYTRVEAITLLAFTSKRGTPKLLLPLLNAQQPQAIQLAALSSLDRLAPDDLGSALVAAWLSFTPGIRDKVVDVLLKRSDRAAHLLTAMEQGTIQRRDLSLMQMVALRQHSDSAIQARATRLIGRASDTSHDQVVQRFRPALDLQGDRQHGKVLFQERCQSCHRLGDMGFAVGPDLTGARSGGKEKLLLNMLDPNREVLANYFGYTVESQDGESTTGLIVSETATTVTVRQPLALEVVIPRSRITKIQASQHSLMPEGLEEGLVAQDVADLLDFISFGAP